MDCQYKVKHTCVQSGPYQYSNHYCYICFRCLETCKLAQFQPNKVFSQPSTHSFNLPRISPFNISTDVSCVLFQWKLVELLYIIQNCKEGQVSEEHVILILCEFLPSILEMG